MKQLCKAAFYRMFHSKGVQMTILLTAVAAVLYYVLAYMLAQGTFPQSQAGSVTALGDAMILWLFGSLMTGLLIGSDFENRTIHAIIGYGRNRILLQYLLVYLAGMALLTLPYLLGSAICMAAGVDMAGAEGATISIYLDNVLRSGGEYPLWKIVLTYLSYALVYISQISICIPVALGVRKPLVVTAFGFLFGMITALLAAVSAKVEILDRLYSMTPYAYGLDKINLEGAVSDMWWAILVSILFLGIMGAISWLLFRRADIK